MIPFLEGFSGNVIQSDGYAGYDAAVAYWNENHPDHKIELCNCNIHARRKFADSVKATKYVLDMHPKKVTVLKVTGVELVTLFYF